MVCYSAPGLSHLGPGPPGPGVSCLCPSPPRLCSSCCPPPLSPQRSRPCPRLTCDLWIQSPSRAACFLRVPTLGPSCQLPPPLGHCTSVQRGFVPARERGSSPPLTATALQFTTLLSPVVRTAATSILPSLWHRSLSLWGHPHPPADALVLPLTPRELSEEQGTPHTVSDSVSADPVSFSPLCYSRMFLSRFPVTVSYPTRGPTAVLIFGVQQ